jgi:hypothetical protein
MTDRENHTRKGEQHMKRWPVAHANNKTLAMLRAIVHVQNVEKLMKPVTVSLLGIAFGLVILTLGVAMLACGIKLLHAIQ